MNRLVPTIALLAILWHTPELFAQPVTWSQYQGNAAHNGSVDRLVNPASLAPLWTVTAGSLGATSLATDVSTNGSSVYVTAHLPSSGGYGNHRVVSMSQSTGLTNWTYARTSYGGGASAPSVQGNMVYAQFGGHSGISGGNPTQYPYMVGLNATTGAQVFDNFYAAQWGYANQPTVTANGVFAHAGYYGGFRGYNSSTGTTLWTNTAMPQQTWTVPAADNSRIYLFLGEAGASPGPSSATFYAINQSNGAVGFSFIDPVGASPQYTQLALGGLNNALVRGGGSPAGPEIISFNLAAGGVLWRSPMLSSGALAVDAARVYVPSGDRIRIVDETNGTQVGQMVVGGGQNLNSNVLLTDNLAFVSSSTNTYAFDRTTLTQVWSTAFGGTLAFGDGVLFVSNGQQIRAFSAPSPIPEPGSAVALAGLFGLVSLIRRRKQA